LVGLSSETHTDAKENEVNSTMKLLGTGRGEKLKGKTAQTIYEVDGDTFRFLAARQDGRPERFPDKEGVGDSIYLVFKRVK
jgi:hypothetical protein